MYFLLLKGEDGGPSDDPKVLQILVKEPQDDNPSSVEIQETWIVADLAMCLASTGSLTSKVYKAN